MSWCARRARATFYKQWSPVVGSAAAQALFTAMFFAGLKAGDSDAEVEYKSEEQQLVARSKSRCFELQVPKNGYTITIVVGTTKNRVNDPTDVRRYTPRGKT